MSNLFSCRQERITGASVQRFDREAEQEIRQVCGTLLRALWPIYAVLAVVCVAIIITLLVTIKLLFF